MNFWRCIGSGRSTVIFRLWCVRQKTTLEREQKSLELGAWDFVLKNSSPGIMRLRAGNAIEKSKVRFLEYDFLTGIYGQQKFYQATRELLDQRAGSEFCFYPF